jgi:hypothetical protein
VAVGHGDNGRQLRRGRANLILRRRAAAALIAARLNVRQRVSRVGAEADSTRGQQPSSFPPAGPQPRILTDLPFPSAGITRLQPGSKRRRRPRPGTGKRGRAGAAGHQDQADNHGHQRTTKPEVGKAVRRWLDSLKLAYNDEVTGSSPVTPTTQPRMVRPRAAAVQMRPPAASCPSGPALVRQSLWTGVPGRAHAARPGGPGAPDRRRIEVAAAVQGEADRGVPGPGGDLLWDLPSRNPQRHLRCPHRAGCAGPLLLAQTDAVPVFDGVFLLRPHRMSHVGLQDMDSGSPGLRCYAPARPLLCPFPMGLVPAVVSPRMS